MPILYDIGIGLYHTGIHLAAPFNDKANKWVKGRKNIFTDLKAILNGVEHPIWMHCSSYGEYEQGKPIIDALHKKYPDKKILLTFYSPSGSEVVKPKEKNLIVMYLPAEGAKNAERFLNIVKPSIAIFVKYEYWYHYLHTLKKHNIPTFLVSGIFRIEQNFFQWYGKLFQTILPCFDRIFVQDEASIELLKTIGIEHAEVSGDTRFDRVIEIAEANEISDELESFVANSNNVLVAGSTWPKDEELISKFFNQGVKDLKLIIAPHEVHKEHILQLRSLFKNGTVLWSERETEDLQKAQILIIDTIGVLSRTYRYGTIAYVGGGFNDGIHNTLEAAVYGLPILFGPNYEKFKEARDLIEVYGAECILDQSSFNKSLTDLTSDDDLRSKMAESSKKYVQENRGATRKFLEYLSKEVSDLETKDLPNESNASK